MRTFLASLKALCCKLVSGFANGQRPADFPREDGLRRCDDSSHDPRFGGGVPIVGVL